MNEPRRAAWEKWPKDSSVPVEASPRHAFIPGSCEVRGRGGGVPIVSSWKADITSQLRDSP